MMAMTHHHIKTELVHITEQEIGTTKICDNFAVSVFTIFINVTLVF